MPQGVCSSYHGTVCKGYLKDAGRIWFNSSQEHAGGQENENIVKGLWKEMIETYSEPCRSAAEVGILVFKIVYHRSSFLIDLILQKLLCTYAFPVCGYKNGYEIGLPICYEDCIAVKDLFCYKEWAVVEENKNRQIFIKSRGHFELPNCEKFPKNNFNLTSPSCSSAELTEMKKDEITCKY